MTDQAFAPPTNRNLRLAGMLGMMVLGMVGVAYAAVPLYQLFCQVTGFGGTTQRAEDNPKGVLDR
jgi:cytochrome c oxidase assembly protein subunit 11